MYVSSFFVLSVGKNLKEILLKINNKEKRIIPSLYKFISIQEENNSEIFINGNRISKSIINLEDVTIATFRGEANHFDFTDETVLNIIGHRGVGQNTSHVLENTVESFNMAFDKVEWVELDVQLIQNSVPIVHHDTLFFNKEEYCYFSENKDKIYKENDKLLPQTLDYVLKNIIKGGKINLEIKYPLFQDSLYLNLLNTKEDRDSPLLKYFNAALQYDKQKYYLDYDVPTLVDSILNVIYLNNFRNIIFSSFSPSVLLNLKTRVPQARILLLIDVYLEELVDFCLKVDLSGIVFKFDCLNEEKIRKLTKVIDVYVYNVKTRHDYDFCMKMGIKGVITDYINDLLSENDA